MAVIVSLHLPCFWWPWKFWRAVLKYFACFPQLRFFWWFSTQLRWGHEFGGGSSLRWTDISSQARVLLSTSLLTVNVDLGQLVELVLVHFLNCEVNCHPYLHTILSCLEKSHYVLSTYKEWKFILHLPEGLTWYLHKLFGTCSGLNSAPSKFLSFSEHQNVAFLEIRQL